MHRGIRCIYLNDITDGQLENLKGKKVQVTGQLHVIEGKRKPAKARCDGGIYEPYKEPDKKFMINPVFKILDNDMDE